MPNTKLIDLPANLFSKHMTLDNNTINSLTLTCKYFSFFQKNPKGKGGAYLLMEKIIDFNLIAVKQIAEKNPDWMFEAINYQFENESFVLSPLLQSFRMRDSYAWKILLEIAKKNPEHLKNFEFQMSLEIDCFDIQPLLNAYADHSKKYKEIRQKENINPMDEEVKDKILLETCAKVGLEQAKLPKHMLYEMFRLGVSAYNYTLHHINLPFIQEDCSEICVWHKHKFKVDANKPPLRKFICCIKGEGVVEVVNLISLLRSGKGVAVRGDYTLGADILAWASGSIMDEDKKSFETLYYQRDNEYTAQLSSLKQKKYPEEVQIHHTTFQQ